MPFKNCDPFKVASEEDMVKRNARHKAARVEQELSRITMHVSGHLSPQYVLILLGYTGPFGKNWCFSASRNG
jgi:hypothetical protein